MRVDKAKGYEMCCAECKARAAGGAGNGTAGGCVAFSVNYYL